VSGMGRKWRFREQIRPLFEVFLKKVGFCVVDVCGCVLKKVVFWSFVWLLGGRWMVDGGWTHNFLWVLKKSGNRWIPVFRSMDFEKPQFLDRYNSLFISEM
jgi:hypothetical protein